MRGGLGSLLIPFLWWAQLSLDSLAWWARLQLGGHLGSLRIHWHGGSRSHGVVALGSSGSLCMGSPWDPIRYFQVVALDPSGFLCVEAPESPGSPRSGPKSPWILSTAVQDLLVHLGARTAAPEPSVMAQGEQRQRLGLCPTSRSAAWPTRTAGSWQSRRF